MLGVTLFGLFLTPVFYVLVRGRKPLKRPSGDHPAPVVEGGADHV
jgi:hypothetical protein